jgi:putative addiction module component (TIGR02574 family)
MAATVKDLGIDRMSVDDRLDLMNQIWDSIAADSNRSYLNEAQRHELERRLAEHEANPNDVIPWEQVKTEALTRLER